MPRRDDIQKILVLGSGPIVIGQAAEFDYSGAQACKVLLEEGYEVVLVNSNPATIMTDPEFATATYVEPLLPGPVRQVIERERPDALLPTLGGQTALNLAKALHEDGTLEELGVELIGANYDAINRAEDREVFDATMQTAGLRTAKNVIATGVEDALLHLEEVGLPAIVRPAFTLGGRGGGIARTREQYAEIVAGGIAASPIGQVLIDESVLGWGEFELEVMRDGADNVVIVCSIENIDPMGVHTGDSVTVAPQQTLTDRLYQKLRDQAIAVIRAVGVETGGSNVQFAVNPVTEEIVVIEMNPRVSRSSALASKATGFPIAKIAARLAVGYRLDEIDNDITRRTPASFEPALDYVVVKWPRFAFEKFPGVDAHLTTHMKSVGEVMAIGRTFRQAFAKAMRSRELDAPAAAGVATEELLESLESPSAERYDVILELLGRGVAAEEIRARTGIDPWYLRELQLLATEGPGPGVRTYRAVDTCAAEFEAETPYYYSAWESGSPVSEVVRGDKPSVMILGSGPNRIGQGIEFDYCAVHASQTLRDRGWQAVMINSNPETVSTDFDASTRLYFESLDPESVRSVIEAETGPGDGLLPAVVAYGGQTPLNLAAPLAAAGVPLLGSDLEAIDQAEERTRFAALLDRLGIPQPEGGMAHSIEEALTLAERIGYPVIVRPSFVIGGLAIDFCYSPDDLIRQLAAATVVDPDRPVRIDRYLEGIEVDVDAVSDGERVLIPGLLEHVERAGVHSGDSVGVFPPQTLSEGDTDLIVTTMERVVQALGARGLCNAQFIVRDDGVYLIEVNPRASRTVPFMSKVTGVPMVELAVRISLGERLEDLGWPNGLLEPPPFVAVKAPAFSTAKLRGVDPSVGPGMQSTGEVIGISEDPRVALAKALTGASLVPPSPSSAEADDAPLALLSIAERDKEALPRLADALAAAGYRLAATEGTRAALAAAGHPDVRSVAKLGAEPDEAAGEVAIIDLIATGEVRLVVNTPTPRSGAVRDAAEIRLAATAEGILCLTAIETAVAAAEAMRPEIAAQLADVRPLGEWVPAPGAPRRVAALVG